MPCPNTTANMSRLIVKNLPKTVTEDIIRKLFGEKGTVTDVQLKFTPEGKFRKFAFVGYQTDNEADQAIESFNKTFINSSKITVEKCSVLGDENKPKAWSKYAPDNATTKKILESEEMVPDKKTTKIKGKKDTDETIELLQKYKDDPLFEEFLQVHAPDETAKLHQLKIQTSGKRDSGQESGSDLEVDNAEAVKLANEEISDLEYMKQLMKGEGERKPRQKMEKKVKEKVKLFTVKLRDLPYNVKKKDIKQFFKPLTCFSIRIPRQVHGFAYVGFKTENLMKKALVKDRSFIKGKRVSVVKYEQNDNLSDMVEESPVKNKWKSQEEGLKNEEDIAESGKIFFRNLSYTTTEDDLEKLFSKYGPLAGINVPVDKTTKKLKGFGTVTFLMPEHAVKAYLELDGTVMHGRMLHLLPGKSKDTAEDYTEDSSNFKKKKAAKQKAQAGSTHNWNSLFLGHDAVAEVVADAYGTTKEAVVGPHVRGSAAVRLALGETQIVAETRKYLEENGVLLDAFANVGPRSKMLILVKNLPCKTDAKEIRMVFEKHGYVSRVILPPSGITALVEFLEPSEAKRAFTKLAYSKFKNVPVYLEWAPENSLVENVKITVKGSEGDNNIEQEALEEGNVEAHENEEEPEPDTTLFVKNLNFKTTDEDLRKHFEGCGRVHYANVAMKKDKNDEKNKLSMGYGFVRFVHKKSADKALKNLQQSVLDGKSLELKRSERTLKDEPQAAKKPAKKTKQTGTKILVRNVPFQATGKEIRELFSTFGEIKALRLPKKMGAGTDSHRGFAFVDFSSNSDAKAAFESLSQSTHLYGRRLVLEWAAEEEGVDEIRKRTADHFKPTEEVKSKKSVFNID